MAIPSPRPIRVATAPAVQLVHQAQHHPDPAIRDAADTILSALVLHLRNPEAVLPAECEPHLRLLMQASDKP